jgi:glycerophosphoryl diester phosphodiesterase
MVVQGLPEDAFPIVVAHRGASSRYPENTLPAFEAAVELGAPVVELDVRLSADGVPVVIHDADVSRTTGGRGLVHELTAAEIVRLPAGTPEVPARVPTLGQALAVLSGRAGVAIEIKNIPGEPAYDAEGRRLVAAALAEVERSRFEGPVLVISFDLRSLATARELAPDVTRGLLSTDHLDPRDALALALGAGHHLVLPQVGAVRAAGPGFVEEAHAAGVRVGTWTVDDAPTLGELFSWGVDAIASNDVEAALAELARFRSSR